MAELVSAIVTDLKNRFSDLTTTDAVRYINVTHRQLCNVIPELSKGALDIDLVNNQASYPLSGDIVEIEMAYCRLGGGHKLLRTSQGKLIEENPDWGSDAAASPTEFYIVGDLGDPLTNVATLKIALHPKPNADLTAGLRVYFTQIQTMITSDALPGGLATYQVYTEGASYLAAEALRGAGAGAGYFQQYEYLLKVCADRWHKQLPQWPLSSTFPVTRTK